MADDIGGVWRTIGGRRVFIKDGQDLSTAMKESKKFKSLYNVTKYEKELQNNLKELNTIESHDISLKLKKQLDSNIKDYYNKFHEKDNIRIDGIIIGEELNKMEKNWKNETLNNFLYLQNEYYSNIICIDYKEDKIISKSLGSHTHNDYDMSFVQLENNSISKEKYYDSYTKGMKSNHNVKVDDDNIYKATITHEFAHSLARPDSKYQKVIWRELEPIYKKYSAEISQLEFEMKKANNEMIINFSQDKWDKAMNLQKKYDKIFISKYALSNSDGSEFIAEAFTMAKLNSNPSPYATQVLEIIDKYCKRSN